MKEVIEKMLVGMELTTHALNKVVEENLVPASPNEAFPVNGALLEVLKIAEELDKLALCARERLRKGHQQPALDMSLERNVSPERRIPADWSPSENQKQGSPISDTSDMSLDSICYYDSDRSTK